MGERHLICQERPAQSVPHSNSLGPIPPLPASLFLPQQSPHTPIPDPRPTSIRRGGICQAGTALLGEAGPLIQWSSYPTSPRHRGTGSASLLAEQTLQSLVGALFCLPPFLAPTPGARGEFSSEFTSVSAFFFFRSRLLLSRVYTSLCPGGKSSFLCPFVPTGSGVLERW